MRINAAGGSASRTISTPVLVVRRRVLDATLFELVRPRVEVREGHAVDRLLRCGDRVCFLAGKTDLGDQFGANSGVVVGADGASSIVARLSSCREARTDDLLIATRAYYRGVATTEPALQFHFLPELGGGYLWIFPLGGDRYNVGMGRWLSACLLRAVVDSVTIRIRSSQRAAQRRGLGHRPR